jgi:vancomycin resistance protein YoaR
LEVQTAVQPVTSKRLTNIFFFLGVIMLFSMISLVAINAAFLVTDEIYHGVTVGDIDVGGLSVQVAENKIATVFRERIEQVPITLTYQKQSWSISAKDIDLSINPTALANQAYSVGRSGNIFYRLQERYLTIYRGHIVPLTVTYNHEKIKSFLNEIARTIDREPVSATLNYRNYTVTIVPDTKGYKLDTALALSDLETLIETKLSANMPLPVKELAPTLVASDLEGIDGVIAAYSTQFNASDQNRTQNIALASKNVNGVLVRRGETFSFNTFVGPRLAEYGYKEAPVFINGKLLPDWGGGVCQVSSTLYNAVLLADLAIEERTSHFRPPGYVPLGQDATVAYNQLDFKFKNTSQTNIYISSEVYGNQVSISIFGKLSDNPPEIQIVSADKKVLEPNTIIKQDPQLELGKEVVEIEGQKGYQVTTYRVHYINGKESNRELLAGDEFEPEDRVIRVGSKLPARQAGK